MDRFIAAALAILTTDGIDALTVGRIAADTGYAVGALYRYFPSKDAVIVALQTRAVEGLHLDIEARLDRAEGVIAATPGMTTVDGALLRLLVAGKAYLSLAIRHPAEFGLLSQTLADPRVLVDDAVALPALAGMWGPLALMGQVFGEAEAVGALTPGDAMHRTVVYWLMLHGAMQLRKMERLGVPGVDALGIATSGIVALLQGWGAPPVGLQDRVRAVIDETESDDDNEGGSR